MGIYDSVRTARPSRNAFNLSHEKKLTCDMGQLIPILMEEVVPGDKFKIGIESVIRLMPAVAPVLHEVNVFFHYYFVAYRLLDTNWETFITGGVLGTDASSLPTWIPTSGNVTNDNGVVTHDNGPHSLWDYMGFPVTDAGIIPAGAYPLSYTRRAYNKVFNEYYRDETQDAEVGTDSNIVLNRRWEKDYFTSALPWQQRGTAPALPISGVIAVTGVNADISMKNTTDAATRPLIVNTASDLVVTGTPSATANARWVAPSLEVNVGGATTFNVADLRLVFQIQKWMERNARGGVRYIEFINNHFGNVGPRDERLNRAEYIGGTRFPLIISEVLQTSMTSGSEPLGEMAGHGLSVGRDFCASYDVKEFGVIIGIMSVMPRSVYDQGVDRQWKRATRYDFYSPEWANLSEQAVLRSEIYASSVLAENNTIFGYQGRYNEMRTRKSMTCGLMRYGVTGSMAYWHIGRTFASAPALNSTFLKCIPRKDYLAAPSQPALIVNIANIIKAIRPMPIEADPGLIDHN